MKVRVLAPRGVVLFVLGAVLACGGGGGHSPTEPQGPPTADRLTLVRVDPAASTVLRQGAAVTIRPRLHYEMVRSTQGVIFGFVLASGPSGPIPLNGTTFSLVAGNRGEIDLPVTFTVPASAVSVLVQYVLEPDVSNKDPEANTEVAISYTAR
jgi:hypothetical protein